MSLQYAAEAVRQNGRGNDKMLVHMTPSEVKGLQKLAMAYGGSLTTNPETGLPEAGFLESLLPTLIGAGLTIGTGGMINPLTAGAIVGGIQTVRTGDLGQGLMAGLGAYGGAGLGSSLQAAGAATNAATAQAGIDPSLGQAGAGMPGFGASGSAVDTLTQQEIARQAPTTVMGNFAEAGQGAQSLFSSGAAGDTARTAAMEGFGKYSGLEDRTLGAYGTSFAAAAEPLAYVPPYEAPESKYESNYKGPYRPTERRVRFPGEDRDPSDSSEFRFFDNINPYPGFYNEGGPVAPDASSGDFAARLAAIKAQMGQEQAAQAPGLASAINSGRVEGFGMPNSQTTGMTGEKDFGFRQLAPQILETAQTTAESDSKDKTALDNGGNGNGGDNGGGFDDGPRGPNTYADNLNLGGGNYSTGPNPGDPDFPTMSGFIDSVTGLFSTGDVDPEQQDRAAAAAAVAAAPEGSGRDDSYETSDSYGYDYAMGGMTMDNGGFVIDAHTVSEIGNGSSNAGHERLARLGGEPIQGPGDGVSDSIKANIGGVQEARIARDESYLSRDDVKALGGGNLKKGEKMLYKLMAQAHESRKNKGRGQATGLDKLIKKMA